MKRVSILILAMLLVCSSFVGCGAAAGNDGVFTVVCTNFALYDWARELTRNVDGVEILLLADKGKDIHSYEPSAKDMMTISSCELFIGIGGISEKWLAEYLKTAEEKPKSVLLLSELLHDELLPEPQVTRDEHGAGDEHEHSTFDEHLWLSPRLAKKACEGIFSAFVSLDEENGAVYEANFKRYTASLDGLIAMFEGAVADAETKTLVFADRYPFCYLFQDLGLSAFAAFPGCSSESEASFETVVFLAQKADELGLTSIMAVKGSDLAVAKTVAASAKGSTPEILILDSLETVTNKEIESYIGRMSLNVEALKKALD